MSLWMVLLLCVTAWGGAAAVTSVAVGTAFRRAGGPAMRRQELVRIPVARRELSSL